MAESVMTFPKPLAILIAFWVDALLHGIYLLLFLRWVVFNRTVRKGPWKRYYTFTTWAIFLLSNIHTAINLVLLIQGFWDSTTNGGGGPSAFFNGPLDWENQWREYIFQVIMSLLDLMMTHRLWVIWDRNYYIAGFILLIWILELVFGILVPSLAAAVSDTSKTLNIEVNTQLALNVGLQTLLTGLISYRILSPRDSSLKYLPNQHRRRRMKIVQCFVESGALAAIGNIVDIILYTRHNNLHWVANLALGQFYAISSVMIVLRLHDVLASDTQFSLNTISATTGGNLMQARNVTVSHNQEETAVHRASNVFPSTATQALEPCAVEVDDEKWRMHGNVVAEDSLSSVVEIYGGDHDRLNGSTS